MALYVMVFEPLLSDIWSYLRQSSALDNCSLKTAWFSKVGGLWGTTMALFITFNDRWSEGRVDPKPILKVLSIPRLVATLERAQVRADIDARVALHFSLSAEEFTYLLTDFGTLDRSQPGSKDRKGQGIEPCAITRDLCLLNFYEVAQQSPSAVSVPWSKSPQVNLRHKVAQALAVGCVPYVPSQLAVQMFGKA